MDLKGRVAVVTGGSRGIGLAIASSLADHGVDVAISARNADKLETARQHLAERGGRALTIQSDVAEVADVKRLFDVTEEQLGPISILINNAGVWTYAPIDELGDNEFETMVATNLKGAFSCCREFFRRRKGLQQGGDIINISSKSGVEGMPEMAGYCSTKFGVMGLTESLQLEGRRLDIRLSAVCPGLVQDVPGEAAGLEAPIPTTAIVDTVLYLLKLPRPVVVRQVVVDRYGSLD